MTQDAISARKVKSHFDFRLMASFRNFDDCIERVGWAEPSGKSHHHRYTAGTTWHRSDGRKRKICLQTQYLSRLPSDWLRLVILVQVRINLDACPHCRTATRLVPLVTTTSGYGSKFHCSRQGTPGRYSAVIHRRKWAGGVVEGLVPEPGRGRLRGADG